MKTALKAEPRQLPRPRDFYESAYVLLLWCIRRLRQQRKMSFQARRYKDFILRADDDAFDIRQPFDQRHTCFRPHDERTRGETVGENCAPRNDGHAPAPFAGLACGRIQNVMITAS